MKSEEMQSHGKFADKVYAVFMLGMLDSSKKHNHDNNQNHLNWYLCSEYQTQLLIDLQNIFNMHSSDLKTLKIFKNKQYKRINE